MNQYTNLSQHKADSDNFRDLAFEVSCHLDQLAAFMLQASCLEEHQDEIKASCMAKAVSKTSLIIFNKTLLIIDQMEELFKSQKLVEFRNSFAFVESAVFAISETNLTLKHQANYFYGIFHVLKELEKDINDMDLNAEIEAEKAHG
ncbi:TPA: hypothetical protein OTR57_001523 [Acinetobacter baumannii]|nr:hypothetical protein [Acinetobacter baumannii]